MPRPAPAHWPLHSTDSVVAEYTLIQMARTIQDNICCAGESGHGLSWDEKNGAAILPPVVSPLSRMSRFLVFVRAGRRSCPG